jgi:hypothetical protein
MTKIYLEYPDSNDVNPKGWSSATPLHLIIRQLGSQLVNKEEEADIILFNKYPMERKDFSNFRKVSKPAIVIWVTDDLQPLNMPQNYKIFRTSLCKSIKNNNEYAFSWCSPIIYKEDMYSINNKPFDLIFNKLSIGFCGCDLHPIRKKCIQYFEQSQINTDFVKRHTFIRGFTDQQQQKYRKEDFINNMKNNIFILAPRGGGNWSLRLYETMAYGRIPVLPLTDTVLPFEDKIDWNNTIIMGNTPQELENKMVEWYNKGEEFIKNKQKLCRQVWNDYLSMEGFSKHFTEYV